MECQNYMGFMAVVAASGSVVLVALEAHRRLASDFQKKFEVELRQSGGGRKKKVRFADDVVEPSSNNVEYRRRRTMMMKANCNRAIHMPSVVN